MRPHFCTFRSVTPIVLVLAAASLAACISSDEDPDSFRPPGPAGAERLSMQPHTGDVVEIHLYVSENVERSPHDGKRFHGFGFSLSPDGPFTIPGPEIRVKEGDLVRATLHSVGIAHTVHWHGLSVPWAMDGVPFVTQTVAEGDNVYTYEFVAWETGTYWYHCHVEAPSHVDAGLFGAFIVEPRDPSEDPPFDREHTLMLHEADSQYFRTFEYASEGYQPGPDDIPQNPFDAVEGAKTDARTMVDLAGFITGGTADQWLTSEGPRDYYPLGSLRYRPLYDTFMINGKSYPDTEPVYIESGETLRLRLINAGQLVHAIHLHGHHFLVTHKDGYRLPAPYYADTLLVGPAERYDIYVDGYNPGIWDLHDHGGGWGVGGYASNDYAFPGGMATMLVYEDFEYARLPEVQPGRTAGDYAVFAPSYDGQR